MNIVIVGGGTSGWTTALILANEHPQHHFTVIESSKIGIIGVGESTTGYFTNLFDGRYGLHLKEFMLATNATPKYAIKHQNWSNNVTDYYTQWPLSGTELTVFVNKKYGGTVGSARIHHYETVETYDKATPPNLVLPGGLKVPENFKFTYPSTPGGNVFLSSFPIFF